jgi:hypothetical protein
MVSPSNWVEITLEKEGELKFSIVKQKSREFFAVQKFKIYILFAD